MMYLITNHTDKNINVLGHTLRSREVCVLSEDKAFDFIDRMGRRMLDHISDGGETELPPKFSVNKVGPCVIDWS